MFRLRVSPTFYVCSRGNMYGSQLHSWQQMSKPFVRKNFCPCKHFSQGSASPKFTKRKTNLLGNVEWVAQTPVPRVEAQLVAAVEVRLPHEAAHGQDLPVVAPFHSHSCKTDQTLGIMRSLLLPTKTTRMMILCKHWGRRNNVWKRCLCSLLCVTSQVRLFDFLVQLYPVSNHRGAVTNPENKHRRCNFRKFERQGDCS